MKILFEINGNKKIKLDKESLILYKDGKSKDILSTKEQRFNTLAGLYSLKKTWKSTQVNDWLYLVKFQVDEKVETYTFNKDNIPDNFLTFYNLISRLTGELYG